MPHKFYNLSAPYFKGVGVYVVIVGGGEKQQINLYIIVIRVGFGKLLFNKKSYILGYIC